MLQFGPITAISLGKDYVRTEHATNVSVYAHATYVDYTFHGEAAAERARALLADLEFNGYDGVELVAAKGKDTVVRVRGTVSLSVTEAARAKVANGTYAR
jgi:hypothetical protein